MKMYTHKRASLLLPSLNPGPRVTTMLPTPIPSTWTPSPPHSHAIVPHLGYFLFATATPSCRPPLVLSTTSASLNLSLIPYPFTQPCHRVVHLWSRVLRQHPVLCRQDPAGAGLHSAAAQQGEWVPQPLPPTCKCTSRCVGASLQDARCMTHDPPE